MNIERRNSSFSGWWADVGYIYLIVCVRVVSGFLVEVLYTAASSRRGATGVVQSDTTPVPPTLYRL